MNIVVDQTVDEGAPDKPEIGMVVSCRPARCVLRSTVDLLLGSSFSFFPLFYGACRLYAPSLLLPVGAAHPSRFYIVMGQVIRGNSIVLVEGLQRI